ncbi:MAG TPA: DUF6249 domain-containing protein [Bacillota bacterium]|nr:DUF6249 domain-containing protein [Bacillota bacterium]
MIAGILVPVLSLAIIFGFVGWMRYLRHLEHLAYYEALAKSGATASQGVDASRTPPPPPAMAPRLPPDPRSLLHRGVLTGAVGVALLVGLLTLGIGPWLVAGLIPLFVGLVEVLFALFDGKAP